MIYNNYYSAEQTAHKTFPYNQLTEKSVQLEDDIPLSQEATETRENISLPTKQICPSYNCELLMTDGWKITDVNQIYENKNRWSIIKYKYSGNIKSPMNLEICWTIGFKAN